MIIVTGAVVARPETLDELSRICAQHSARSRAEPGCLAHNVHADCENPLRLVFLERWADLAALRAHFAVPASVAFVKAARRLADGGTAMEVFEARAVQV